MRIPPPHRSRAFTLIEIMVSIGIFMLLMIMIYATWAVVMRASQVGQTATLRSQRERVTLRTLENSLMCLQSFQASQKYYSFNVVGGDQSLLSFASRLPDVFPRNGKFGGFNLRRLTYSLEVQPGGSKALVLRQNPILMDMDADEQKSPLILARDVKMFQVECWDTNQLNWVTEWDDTNSIPPMLRVTLAVGGISASGEKEQEVTVVRAFSMPSSEMPAVVQTGLQGGGALPGGFGRPGQ
ncbi:MAG TPA: prepilin-type N-terminal cleavage/methylation domain-containing protein [Phycisphaerae bacterium]|jgi:type II secretory pathway pseudopilin PulG